MAALARARKGKEKAAAQAAPKDIVANRAFLMPQIENGAFFKPLRHFLEDKNMPHGFGHFWAFFQDPGKKLLK